MKHARKKRKPIRLVYVHDAGGLCNRLFPFANLVAFAAEHGLVISNPAFAKHAELFEGTRGGVIPSYPADYSRLKRPCRRFAGGWARLQFRLMNKLGSKHAIQREEAEGIKLEEEDAFRHGNVSFFLSALYVLAPKSVRAHGEIIRDYFRPIHQIRREVDQCLAAARAGCDVLVGVHIRQGDYREHFHGLLYYETDEYCSLMRSVCGRFPGQRIRFLVASDTPQDPSAFPGLDCVFAPGEQVSDLYSLAGCDYLIGPPSTYSQWASFYGQVPRYVHNRKVEERNNRAVKTVNLDGFRLHRSGYGRFADES